MAIYVCVFNISKHNRGVWIFCRLISCSTRDKLNPLDGLLSLTPTRSDWLTDWLTDWTHWLTGWLTDWLTDWLADWLIDWTTHSLAHSLSHSLTHSLTRSLTHKQTYTQIGIYHVYIFQYAYVRSLCKYFKNQMSWYYIIDIRLDTIVCVF